MKVMSIRIFLVLFILVLICPSSLIAAPEKRTALVIGNGAYSSAPLKNPVNDATDIAATLKRLGFDVILKKNASMQDMENAIRDFGSRLKRGGEGLFFYAGHGVQIGGKNYLIPIGAKIDKETDAKYQAIDAEMVLDEMANAGNHVNIMILDACRDNPLGRSLRGAGRGLAIISDAPQGMLITYSTSPGKTAADGEGRNSRYTAALIKYMTEPGQPVEQVFKKVRQTLTAQSDGKQIPWELSSLQGNFFFAPTSAGKSAAIVPEGKATAGSDELDDENRRLEAEQLQLEEEKASFAKKKILEEKRQKIEEEKEQLAAEKETARHRASSTAMKDAAKLDALHDGSYSGKLCNQIPYEKPFCFPVALVVRNGRAEGSWINRFKKTSRAVGTVAADGSVQLNLVGLSRSSGTPTEGILLGHIVDGTITVSGQWNNSYGLLGEWKLKP